MRLLLVALGALALVWPAAAERLVTDSAGREVAVPDRIERVFAAGPPASIVLYVLAPDRMIGWPRAPRAEELPYIAPEYRDLPEVGWLTGRGDTVNLEVLLQSVPDLILDFGSVRDTYVSLAERVQAQTGIPHILIDGTFENTAEAVGLLGAVLGVEERAEALAAYVEDSFAEIGKVLAEVPEADRPRVYLARGPNGQETGLVGSINTEIIERVGAINVARDPTGASISAPPRRSAANERQGLTLQLFDHDGDSAKEKRRRAADEGKQPISRSSRDDNHRPSGHSRRISATVAARPYERRIHLRPEHPEGIGAPAGDHSNRRRRRTTAAADWRASWRRTCDRRTGRAVAPSCS